MSAVVEPLQFGFMRAGIAEVFLLAVACGLIGPFVVQRNLTFFGHALSHTVFPALVVGVVLGISPPLAAAVGATFSALLVFVLQRSPSVSEDSAVGIVYAGLFAAGVVLVGWFHIKSPDVSAAVTGNLLAVSAIDLLVSAVLVLLLLTGTRLLFRGLVCVSFDRSSALALGLPVRALDAALLLATAGTAVVAVKAVGVILTVALLVTPAATARLWSNDLKQIMPISAGFVATAGVVGLYVAYYTRVSPAAIIVLVLGAFFGLSVLRGTRPAGQPYGFRTHTRYWRRRTRARRGAAQTGSHSPA